MTKFSCYVKKCEKPEERITIADLIPVGRDNAIRRKELLHLCEIHNLIDTSKADADRQMRKLIERARIDYVILNLSNGVGYYRVSREDLQDLQRYIKQEDKRAIASIRNHAMAKKLYEDFKAGRM